MRRPTPSFQRPVHTTLAVLWMMVAAVGVAIAPASGTTPSPAPVLIVVDAVSSSVAAPEGTPAGAVPRVLVEAGEQFFVDVSFYDATGAPAAFSKNTTLSITANTSAGNAPSPSTGVAPRGATSARLTTSLPRPANQVRVTVGVAGKKARTVTPGTSSPAQAFDVLKELRLDTSAPGTQFARGIGGDGECASATREEPVCGVVLLPLGANSSQVLLSLGACDSAYAGCGSSRGSVVQTLADLDGLYSPTAPATIVVKCDKSLCGTGAIKSVQLSFSLLGNAALEPAPACPAKNTVGSGQDACVDYVQSHRDGAGDTLLYFLFTRDARVSVR